MNKRVEIEVQPAFILHTWPYRNSSLLLDIFTQDYGRIGAIARGVMGARKSSMKALLQPFQPLLISCVGHHDLLMLRQVEARGMPFVLAGKPLFCGLYLNELLQRLLTRFDPYVSLFALYEDSIAALIQPKSVEIILRRFEKQLLAELGYGLSLTLEAHNGSTIQAEHHYYYNKEEGYFCRITDIAVQRVAAAHTVFHGKNLLAIADNEFSDTTVLADAKRLLRLALSRVLGDRPLKTRLIFTELGAVRNSLDWRGNR